VNDVLGRFFDSVVFEQDYDHVVGALAEVAGRGVLTMTLHDVASGLPLPRDKRVVLRRRVEQANTAIERVSERHGAWMVDARAATPMNQAGMLSIDRLHPNRRGHRYIAACAVNVLRDHDAVGGMNLGGGYRPLTRWCGGSQRTPGICCGSLGTSPCR